MSQLSENKIRTQPPTLEEFDLDVSIYNDYHGKKIELEKNKNENDKKIKAIIRSPIFGILSAIALFSAVSIVIFLWILGHTTLSPLSVIFCGLSVFALLWIGSWLDERNDFFCNLFSSGAYNKLKETKREIEKQIKELTENIKNTVRPFEEAFVTCYQKQLDDFYATKLYRKKSGSNQFEESLSEFALMVKELSTINSSFVTNSIKLGKYESYVFEKQLIKESSPILDKGQVNHNLQTFKDSEELISIRNFANILIKPQEQEINEVIPPEKIYRTARKIDNWEEINKKRKITGSKGEEIAVVIEQEYLESINRKDLSDKVRHVSLEDGDGLGYDVLSFFEDGREKYIEVKSTTTSFNAPFYLSRNELGFLNEHDEDYFLYRILITADTPQFKVYSSSEVLEMNEIVPIQYLVRTK